MPIYEYECQGCGQTTEAMQKFSDPPLTKCEKCGGALTKLISRTSFQLKGTGWYQTDYKKPGASAPSETKAETPPTPSAEPKKPSGGCGGGACGTS